MSDSVRVLFVPAGGLGNASARTRLYAYLPYLHRFGVQWHVASYYYHKYDAPRRFAGRLWQQIWIETAPWRSFLAHRRASTLFFQKKSFLGWNLSREKRAGRRIVYDFDDAIFYRVPDEHSANVQPETDQEFEPMLREVLRLSDTVLVSGEVLKSYAARFAKDVRVLPSVVPEVAAAPAPRRNPPVIGWVGAPENLPYLWEITGVLKRLQEERPELEIWLCTSEINQVPAGLSVKYIPWSLKAEAEIIPRFTVGVAPLADTEWCRAKMNFKALVYLSHGVPAVVSPVGFPEQDFEHNSSILLARTDEDWYKHITTLLDDSARRDHIARGGLAVVGSRFLAAERAAEFAQALKG